MKLVAEDCMLAAAAAGVYCAACCFRHMLALPCCRRRRQFPIWLLGEEEACLIVGDRLNVGVEDVSLVQN